MRISRRSSRVRGAAAGWVAASLFALALAAPAQATFPGGNGSIAFTNLDDTPAQNEQVFTVDPGGAGRVQLTSSPSGATAPEWSPDGNKIAFVELAGSISVQSAIGVMNADGSDQHLVTGSGYADLYPAWSPDGTKLAFSRRADCGQNPDCRERDIYTMNADGSAVTEVTHVNGLAESELDWSPDGTAIAFSASSGGLTHVYTVKPDGTAQTRLTSLATVDDGPSWSPDGAKIVFHSYRDEPGPLSSCGFNCNTEVYVMNRDGTGQTRITNEPRNDVFPAWSPDGALLAFGRYECTAFPSCNGGLHTMKTDGSAITPVTSEWQDGSADWQPVPAGGYPRPKGASPFQVFLTPAFKACGAPNRTHGGPLAFPSCAPPVQASDHLTVGTADSNGRPTSSLGSVRFVAVLGNPATQANEADVKVESASPASSTSRASPPTRASSPWTRAFG